jgi:hypothetical protein
LRLLAPEALAVFDGAAVEFGVAGHVLSPEASRGRVNS